MRGLRNEVVSGLVVGLAASWVKALSEPPLQRCYEMLLPPSKEGKELVGADPSGHPDRMPPAVLADRVVRWFGGDGLNSSQRVRMTQVIHYVFGAGLGIGYTSAARRWPAVTSEGGGPAGLAIYLATHGTALPLLRIQEPPWRLPASAALWESTSHVVFGWTMEALRRAVTGQFGPR